MGMFTDEEEREMMMTMTTVGGRRSPWDLMCDPIPPNIPSPELLPGRHSVELMRFDTSPPMLPGMCSNMAN